ncbi:hypothetical protein, partial [Streptomyces parvus]|uniref:hypothetical protein n=1 Tax=Streptomyces parvus TaxID=66428 RepID=UPI0033D63DEF
MDTPKGKATPRATENRKRNEKESGKVGTAGKGKRESEEPGTRNCTARFDRESDTKESDRVGNARQQDKEENE